MQLGSSKKSPLKPREPWIRFERSSEVFGARRMVGRFYGEHSELHIQGRLATLLDIVVEDKPLSEEDSTFYGEDCISILRVLHAAAQSKNECDRKEARHMIRTAQESNTRQAAGSAVASEPVPLVLDIVPLPQLIQ
jgi:hypothetical protein